MIFDVFLTTRRYFWGAPAECVEEPGRDFRVGEEIFAENYDCLSQTRVLPPFVRGRRIASLTRIPPGLGNEGKWQRGNVQKRVACGQNSLENRALRPPVGVKMAP